MMPLSLIPNGEEVMIKRVGGSPEVRTHLSDMGFVPGGNVMIISSLNGNLILNVKESRVALRKEMASKILVG